MRPDSSIQWSAYPALLLAGAFAVGVLLESRGGGGRLALWGAGAVGIAVAFVGLWVWERRRLVSLAPLGRVLAVLLVGVCAGGARYALYQASFPGALSRIADRTPEQALSIVGIVEDAPERARSATRFTVGVDSVKGTSVPEGRIRVTLRPPPWTKDSVAFPVLRQGDRLRLRGTVRPAPEPRNPGGFDYAAYLARRGVCCVMYVGSPEQVVVHGEGRGPLLDFVVAARQHLRRQIERYVPSDDGQAVLRALLLGDRSRISDAQRARFVETGLMHLLAVSGLHVFLVGMVLYVVLRPLLMRFRLRWRTVEIGRAALTVAVLGLYMLLTGGRPSVVRAVIMSALFIGGILFQRSSHPLNTLGVAALVLLALRAPALFDVGFQLSMAAVAAIVAIHPRLMEWVPEPWTARASGEWLASVVSASVAATVGTAPVLLWHFGWVAGGGLVLNVLGIPCTGLALSAAVGMVVVGGLWPVAGAAFGSVADLSVRGLLLTSRWGGDWLGEIGLRVADPGPWVLGAVLAGAVALAQWPRPRHRWRCVAGGLLLLVGGAWTGAVGPDGEPTLDILFFDVGQGDAVLVTTPADRRLLVDTGPRSSGGAAASFSVLPYLERRGIERLDTVVITHPDEDHLGGLPAILRSMRIGRVVHSGQRAETDLYRETRRLLRRQDVPAEAATRGDTLSVGTGVRVQVLGPPVRPDRWGIEGRNEQSVVLHLAYGRTDVLLPGDIEAAAERDLIRAYGRQLGSRVVKIPHHGSSTSSTPAFVRRVTAETPKTAAVVSVGRSNTFGMPAPGVLRRWRSQGARVRSTAHRGAVWLRSDGGKVWTVPWKEGPSP